MKKIMLFVLLFVCILNSCGQKEVIQKTTPIPTQEVTLTQEAEIIPIKQTSGGGAPSLTPTEGTETDELIFHYDDFSGYVEDMTVADDGTLYAICLNEKNKSYSQGKPIRISKLEQYIFAFDKNGECLWRVETMLPILPSADLSYQTTQDAVVEWSDGFLYIVLQGIEQIPVLYRFNPETWEWQELYYFETFSLINNLVFMEDRLYVHGILKKPGEKELVQNPEYVEQYDHLYKGQAIGYMNLANPDAGVTLLPIDVPNDMIKLDEDTLGIYQTGDEAWSLWKYTPAQEKWEKTSIAISYYRVYPEERLEKGPVCQNFAGYEDGCFYVRNLTNLCYQTPDGTELLRFEMDDISYLKTDGSFLYYYYHIAEEKGICRIRIGDLVERFTTEE